MSRFGILLAAALLLTACGRASATGPTLTVSDGGAAKVTQEEPTAVPSAAPATLRVRVQLRSQGAELVPSDQLSALSKYAEIRVSWLHKNKPAGERVVKPQAFLQPFDLGTFVTGDYAITARCFDASGIERAVLTASFSVLATQKGADSPIVVWVELPSASNGSGGGRSRATPRSAKVSGNMDIQPGQIVQPSPDALTWGSSEDDGSAD